jgi:hypothetical protein
MPGDNNSKTQIIVAAIATIGVLGAAIFANWDKFTENKPEKNQARRRAQRLHFHQVTVT